MLKVEMILRIPVDSKSIRIYVYNESDSWDTRLLFHEKIEAEMRKGRLRSCSLLAMKTDYQRRTDRDGITICKLRKPRTPRLEGLVPLL